MQFECQRNSNGRIDRNLGGTDLFLLKTSHECARIGQRVTQRHVSRKASSQGYEEWGYPSKPTVRRWFVCAFSGAE